MKKLISVACAMTLAALTFAATPTPKTLAKGTLWSAGTIAASYDADGAKLGEEKDIGGIIGGKNLKVVNKGGPAAGTIGNETTGYVQVSNGAGGSLFLTVPAGTSKVTICAKAVSGKAFIVKAGKETLLRGNGCCKEDYEDHVIEKKFAEDTVLQISGFGGSNCNIKAIKVE